MITLLGTLESTLWMSHFVSGPLYPTALSVLATSQSNLSEPSHDFAIPQNVKAVRRDTRLSNIQQFLSTLMRPSGFDDNHYRQLIQQASNYFLLDGRMYRKYRNTLSLHDALPILYWEWNTSGAPVWFILNFTDLGYCDHTAGNTWKYTLNEPLWNITGTFFGKIQGLPTDYLTRKPWSCDLGNCECTDHFLWIVRNMDFSRFSNLYSHSFNSVSSHDLRL